MILNFLDLSQHIEQAGNTTRKTLQKFRSRSSVNFASQRYCKTAHVPSQYFSEARGKIATGASVSLGLPDPLDRRGCTGSPSDLGAIFWAGNQSSLTNPNAGKTSPSPNPPRSWVKCRGRRRGLRGPAALEGPAGAARSPGRRCEQGRASDPTGQTPGRVTARRVPVQPPGPLGGPAAPLTSTAARGLARAGLDREGDAAH
ncbi:hypothetical protein J1605_005135 [Eschrichtius robustus]|uniref:Uncharacterized protein n=1 Tax=Eschrichtius robustus TaxID=9764 RepID=A0AB34HE04_ESCRO|nr:hypothetical protein J1605_005135 [Eschrichtius robustus]